MVFKKDGSAKTVPFSYQYLQGIAIGAWMLSSECEYLFIYNLYRSRVWIYMLNVMNIVQQGLTSQLQQIKYFHPANLSWMAVMIWQTLEEMFLNRPG